MDQINFSIRLRPIRLAFLVRITDQKSIENIFTTNSCLWGGMFNPIIPFFKKVPKWWDRRGKSPLTAQNIIDGFLQYFEPDFIIEAESGLAKQIGIPKDKIFHLKDVLIPKPGNKYTEFGKFGPNLVELYNYMYHKEFKFVRRHEKLIVNVTTNDKKFNQFVACVFGSFPKKQSLKYIESTFKNTFDPKERLLTPNNIIKLAKGNHLTVLKIGSDNLEKQFYDSYDPTLFLLNANNCIDLIDFWNLRAIKSTVIAIPIQWIESLSEFCKEFINAYHTLDHPGLAGLKRRITLQISRSITEQEGKQLIEAYLKVNKKGSTTNQFIYPSFWIPTSENHYFPYIPTCRPMLTTRKINTNKSISLDENWFTFNSLSPDFAEDFGSDYRWANVIKIDNRFHNSELATVFPNNFKNPKSPPKPTPDKEILSTTEGLVFYPRHKESKEIWHLTDGSTAFIEWFKENNIEASISDSGKTTLQVTHALGDLKGIAAIAHQDIIQLLNKMAHKQVKVLNKEGESEPKQFYGRTISHKKIKGLMNQINNSLRFKFFSLDGLCHSNVIRIGLEVICNECGDRNWYSLDSLNYLLKCETCLKDFPFPNDITDNRKPNWCYRAIGPFSKPNYASGAYTSALTIRFFSNLFGSYDTFITWAPSLNLNFQSGEKLEIDFTIWYERNRTFGIYHPPKFVLGESKSFGNDSFKSKDITRLKILAKKFPGAILVLSTMKETISKKEKELISSLALWGRKSNGFGETRAPVIILTGTELFGFFSLGITWHNKGGKHANFANSMDLNTGNLHILADLTQQLYLDLPSYSNWLRSKKSKRQNTIINL